MDGLIFKSVPGELVDVAPGKRESVAVISTAALDRDREVVIPSGLVRKQYAGLVVHLNHEVSQPIGKSLWVREASGRVLAKHRFSDATQLSRECFALVQDGVLDHYSVGFIPHEAGVPTPAEKELYGAAKKIYRSWELIEYSLVGVPANPEAVSVAVSKGRVSAETAALLRPVGYPVGYKGEKYSLHEAGVAHARELIRQGRVDRDSPWAPDLHSPGTDGDWKDFSLQFLAEDKSRAADTLDHWHFPVVSGGRVYVHGLRAAISRAGQDGETQVEAAARELLDLVRPKKDYSLLLARALQARL